MVFLTRANWSISGLSCWNSRYRTMRCTAMAKVMINCSDIKFDDITVTSQPKTPKTPIMAMTDKKQQSMGSTIHRRRLKMMPNIPTSRINTPVPKILRSLLIKVIISSAIMVMPPRKRSAWSRYLSITARTAAMFSCCAMREISSCRLICSLTSASRDRSSGVSSPWALFWRNKRRCSIRSLKRASPFRFTTNAVVSMSALTIMLR